MFGIKEYAVSALVVIAIAVVGNYELTIKDLELQTMTLDKELFACNSNVIEYSETLDEQNFEIETYKAWSASADKDIADWKKQPKEIKYIKVHETIEKLVEVNITSEECEDVKAVNNAFKSVKYSDF